MQNKMKKLLHWVNGIKLRYKLAIIYSMFCFLPVMLLFLLSFLQMRSIIDDKEKLNLQSYLQQSVSSMDRTLDGYNSLSDYIAFDRTLAEAFSMEYGTPYEQYEQLTQKVDPILRSSSYFHGGMQRITIYTDNGMVKHDTTVAPVSEIEETDWYQKTLEHPGLNWFVNYPEKTLFSARKLAFSGAREGVNILYMDVDYQKLFTPYAETLISECGLYITDQEGKLVFEESRFSGKNQNYDLTYSEFLEQRDRGSADYTILCEQSNTTGWTVWLYQPVGLAGESMRPIGVMAGVTILICIFAAVLAYFITSGMVSGRIERLTCLMQEVQEGSMDMQVGSDDRDEIGMLYRGFGSMMKRIRTLINEVYLSKITQKEAELKALQAQINPHFLYNTLSLINWKALAAGEEEIDLTPTGEEGILLIKALCGLGRVVSNVNIPNTAGQIPNLPENALVETNALFDRDSIHPVAAGKVPENVKALLMPHIENHERTLKAALTCDEELVVQAFLHDPVVKGKQPQEAQVRSLVHDMIENTRKYLPDGWN